jgi:hypothetical protein
VVLLDERDIQAARHCVEQRPGANYAASNDVQVPALVRDAGEVRGSALERPVISGRSSACLRLRGGG